MEKNVEISLLLDFYGDVLSEKQRTAVEMYYNDDLSLSEIAQDLGISRQGVRDSLKRGEAYLYEMEEKLGLAAKFSDMLNGIAKIRRNADLISGMVHSDEVRKLVDEIVSIAEELAV